MTKLARFALAGAHVGDVLMALPAMQAAAEAGYVPCIPQLPAGHAGVFGDLLIYAGNGGRAVHPDKMTNQYEAWIAGAIRALPGVQQPLGRWSLQVPEWRHTDTPYSLLFPWCMDPAKRMSVDDAVLVANAMRNPVLVSAPGGEALCEQIADRCGAVNLASIDDRMTWPGAIARAEYVVSVDTGSMHMAAALGKRVAGLFFRADQDRYAPPSSVALTTALEASMEVRSW